MRIWYRKWNEHRSVYGDLGQYKEVGVHLIMATIKHGQMEEAKYKLKAWEDFLKQKTEDQEWNTQQWEPQECKDLRGAGYVKATANPNQKSRHITLFQLACLYSGCASFTEVSTKCSCAVNTFFFLVLNEYFHV